MNYKISIIIAVFNGKDHIEKTINSILNQEYQNLELVVIDGGSTDGTIQILEKIQSKKLKWQTEKDRGISDAFNKGLKLSTGDYVNFQGDGDGLLDNKVLTKIFQNYKGHHKIICGNIIRIDKNSKVLFRTKLKSIFKKHSLLFKMALPHQGMFLHKSFFKENGSFDINFKYAMDYELLLRSYRDFPEVKIIEAEIAYWRADGLGEGKTLDIFKEYLKIKKKNKIHNSLILHLIYVFDVLKYLIKKISNI